MLLAGSTRRRVDSVGLEDAWEQNLRREKKGREKKYRGERKERGRGRRGGPSKEERREEEEGRLRSRCFKCARRESLLPLRDKKPRAC